MSPSLFSRTLDEGLSITLTFPIPAVSNEPLADSSTSASTPLKTWGLGGASTMLGWEPNNFGKGENGANLR